MRVTYRDTSTQGVGVGEGDVEVLQDNTVGWGGGLTQEEFDRRSLGGPKEE